MEKIKKNYIEYISNYVQTSVKKKEIDKKIIANAYSGSCGKSANYTVNKNVLTIFGNDDMSDFSMCKKAPWNPIKA